MPTLMQQRLVKEIPKCKTLREASIKAGYSKESRQVYRHNTKVHIAEALSKAGVTRESLTKAYYDCLDLCKIKGDYSTLKATIDSIARLHNFLRDNNNPTQISVFQQFKEELAKPEAIAPIIG